MHYRSDKSKKAGWITIDHHDRTVNRVEDALIINDTLTFYFTYLAHRTEKEWTRKNDGQEKMFRFHFITIY